MLTHGPKCLAAPKSRRWWSENHLSEMWAEPQGNTAVQDSNEPVSLEDPDIRTELVERIRREIAAGTYETQERWNAALDKLMRRLDEE
jgi:hypothetical protein